MKSKKVKKYLMFTNRYRCYICDIEWSDEWNCMCNDKCPECDTEIEPWESEEYKVKANEIPKGVELEDMIEAK